MNWKAQVRNIKPHALDRCTQFVFKWVYRIKLKNIALKCQPCKYLYNCIELTINTNFIEGRRKNLYFTIKLTTKVGASSLKFVFYKAAINVKNSCNEKKAYYKY